MVVYNHILCYNTNNIRRKLLYVIYLIALLIMAVCLVVLFLVWFI